MPWPEQPQWNPKTTSAAEHFQHITGKVPEHKHRAQRFMHGATKKSIIAAGVIGGIIGLSDYVNSKDTNVPPESIHLVLPGSGEAIDMEDRSAPVPNAKQTQTTLKEGEEPRSVIVCLGQKFYDKDTGITYNEPVVSPTNEGVLAPALLPAQVEQSGKEVRIATSQKWRPGELHGEWRGPNGEVSDHPNYCAPISAYVKIYKNADGNTYPYLVEADPERTPPTGTEIGATVIPGLINQPLPGKTFFGTDTN